MAVLNIRVDDRVRDALKERADGEGVTLSELVRDLLMEAVVPVYNEPDGKHGDEPAPESIRIVDRQTLALLHRILAQVLPDDHPGEEGTPSDQLERAKVLEQGYTGEYWREVAGFSTELSKRDCGRVTDILEMFRNITYSFDQLEEDGTVVDEKLKSGLVFRGFDQNDALEVHMAGYVAFQMREDHLWRELRPQIERTDNGNSHAPVLDMYLRMLSEYRRIMDSRERGAGRWDYHLSLDDLELIFTAQTHPSNRRRNTEG